jgi:PAS domain S-box-containing protein
MGKRSLYLIQNEIESLDILWQKWQADLSNKRLENAFISQLNNLTLLISVNHRSQARKFIIKQSRAFKQLIDQVNDFCHHLVDNKRLARINKSLGALHQVELKEKYQASLAYFYNLKHPLDSHAIVSSTDQYGTILSVNSTFCQISGYAKEELIGENHRLLNSKTHDKSFFERMWQKILSGQTWKGTVCNRKKNGQLYWVESTITPRFSDNQELEGFISIRTDVTPTIIAQQEAEAANAAKSKFLASMTHELRTPLNSIIGYSQLLQTSQLDNKQLQHLELIQNSGKYLLSLINELLDLSSIEAGAFSISIEPIDIQQTLEECLRLVSPLAEQKHITLHWHTNADTALCVEGDLTRVKQVIINFLTNAIKYNHPQGDVWACVTPIAENQCVRLSIQDNGFGIAQNKQKHVFEPFNRLGFEASDTEGTGIGLSITKNLIELMNGQIGFESTEHQGSLFWFELPMTKTTLHTLPASTAAPTTRPTLLYIEDNPLNMALMEDMLAQLGEFALFIAPTGEYGLQQARDHQPDIILIDLNLPGLNGSETLSLLKSLPNLQDIGTRFYALSAQANADFDQMGFDGYLLKPLNMDALAALLVNK